MRYKITNLAAVSAVLLISAMLVGLSPLAVTANAQGPARDCLQECVGLKHTCARGCRAQIRDCLRPAREETRLCRQECAAGFAQDSPELAVCEEDCGQQFFAPAREECFVAGRECRNECRPGRCHCICRPGSDRPRPTGCKADCAEQLGTCAKQGRRELRVCLRDCRVADNGDGLVCAQSCFEQVRASHEACKTQFRTCIGECPVD